MMYGLLLREWYTQQDGDAGDRPADPHVDPEGPTFLDSNNVTTPDNLFRNDSENGVYTDHHLAVRPCRYSQTAASNRIRFTRPIRSIPSRGRRRCG